jgi:hypothetical protein
MFPQPRGIVTFVAAVREEALAKEFIGQDSGLRKSPNCACHFQVIETIVNMFVEIVLLYNPRGKDRDGHFHVFVTVQRGGQIEVFYVEAHIHRVGGAENAVP